MTELKDIAKEYDVDLENCVVFIRGNDDILAVDITNAGIRQRSDDTMGFTFSLPPKETLKLEEYFNKFATGEKFYFDISQTGYRPVYYRGLSPINKEVSAEYHPKFNITLFAQKAIVEPEDSYFAPTCACCEFCHIG
ncbi:hypothetical protein [uncultured Methanobrevibacter sp.]|uniref:hypothetical protein n=1 Tax=uncultured Methanobrevibacter sp. TaxID=253161 RepID=UPI0025D6899C|nr:hypothetical protein [uncultured Methanobrevibacter sp.]